VSIDAHPLRAVPAKLRVQSMAQATADHPPSSPSADQAFVRFWSKTGGPRCVHHWDERKLKVFVPTSFAWRKCTRNLGILIY
jgi:hypothetical protein